MIHETWLANVKTVKYPCERMIVMILQHSFDVALGNIHEPLSRFVVLKCTSMQAATMQYTTFRAHTSAQIAISDPTPPLGVNLQKSVNQN